MLGARSADVWAALGPVAASAGFSKNYKIRKLDLLNPDLCLKPDFVNPQIGH